MNRRMKEREREREREVRKRKEEKRDEVYGRCEKKGKREERLR